MKKPLATALLALIGVSPLAAATHDHAAHGGHGAPVSSPASEAPFAEGVVKKIDKAAGKVTVAHGPLVNLNMPPMTMVFRVKDAAWLNQMQVGATIRFVAEVPAGVYTIVRFEPPK